MTCRQCGTEVEAGTKFCGKCGTPVEGARMAPPPATRPPGSPRRRTRTARKAVLFLLVLAVAGGGGYGGYRFWWLPNHRPADASGADKQADGLFARAESLEESGLWETAAAAYRDELIRDPKNAEAALRAGRCYLTLDPPRTRDAQIYLQKAAADAAYREKVNALVADTAKRLLSAGQRQQACEVWQLAVSPDQTYLAAAFQEIVAKGLEAGLAQGLVEARRFFEDALKVYPDGRPQLADACAQASQTAQSSGDLGLALDWMVEAGRHDPGRYAARASELRISMQEADRSSARQVLARVADAAKRGDLQGFAALLDDQDPNTVQRLVDAFAARVSEASNLSVAYQVDSVNVYSDRQTAVVTGTQHVMWTQEGMPQERRHYFTLRLARRGNEWKISNLSPVIW